MSMDDMIGLSVNATMALDPAALAGVETPCYIFDPSVVMSTYSELRAALGTPLIVSLKANPNLDLFVRCAHVFTDGVELASQGELDLIVGRTSAPKFVNTPALDPLLARAAIASRATLVLDNLHQVDIVLGIAANTSSPMRVALRVNASAVAGEVLGRAHMDHFGMDQDALGVAIGRLGDAGIELRGLHVFAGSYTFETCSTALCEKATELVDRVNGRLTKPLEFINLGGGFADDWRNDDERFASYRRIVAKLQDRLTVLHESGRAIFARGGTFAVRVLAVKRLNKRDIVICDGGLAHCFMLAQTEKMLKRLRQPRILPLGNEAPIPVREPALVVGNSCNRADVIGELHDGNLPYPGDLLLFDGCGSYHTYTPVNFLHLKAPRRYLVS
jgi:diaminopimelate decarboxylase